MARLVCRCLNVAVHCKGEVWDSRPLSGSRVLPSGHRLSDVTLHEVEPDTPGLTAEHPVLLVSAGVGDWSVETCSNCGCDVAVSHRQKSRLLVCPGLLSSEEAISQVKADPHFSRVFRILLNFDLDGEEEISGRPRASSLSAGRDDPVLQQIQTQVRHYLMREEEELEQRVREFERREKEKFAQLQQKTLSQRAQLLAAIAKARSTSLSTATQVTTGHSAGDQKEQVTITLHDSRLAIDRNKEEADDALFSLDGFDEEDEIDGAKEGVAFPQSDDEETGTDDSSYRDISSVQAAMASSVPLTVPLFRPPQTHQSEMEEGTGDMASSIKALALSVQNTGVFGDLPRPRVNSAARYK